MPFRKVIGDYYKYGFMKEDGQIVVQPEYEIAFPFGRNGLAPANMDLSIPLEKWLFLLEHLTHTVVVLTMVIISYVKIIPHTLLIKKET